MKSRKRNRLKGYDYSKDNLYFITICVQDRLCCFGNVIMAETEGTGCDLSVHNPHINNPDVKVIMQLNNFGLIVEEKIKWLMEQYEYVAIHNYVIMPNHVHIIIEIDSSVVKDKGVKIKSLSSLVGAFKTTSSKWIHLSGFIEFSWQRSFHDHIIRNEKSYQNITNYIDLNPQKWFQDTFYEKN